MQQEHIYQRIVQHVRIAHVEVIAQDEHGVRVHQINELPNVQQIHIVQLNQVVVVVVHHEKLQIQHNVDV